MPRDDDSVNLEKLRLLAKYRNWTDREILEDLRNRKKTLTPEEMAQQYPELYPYIAPDGSPDTSANFFYPMSPPRGLAAFTGPVDRSVPVSPKRQRAATRTLRNFLFVLAAIAAAALIPPAAYKACHAIDDSYRSVEIEAPASALGAFVDVDGTVLGRIGELEPGVFGFRSGWRSLKLVRCGETLSVKKPGAVGWSFALRNRDGSPKRDLRFTLSPRDDSTNLDAGGNIL